MWALASSPISEAGAWRRPTGSDAQNAAAPAPRLVLGPRR